MSPKHVPLVGDDDFDDTVLRSPLPVLVDFATAWCPPCRVLEPILEALAEKRDRELRVVRIDGDASPALAARYRVRGFPTVIAFVGGTERGRHTGVASAAALLDLFAPEARPPT